MEYSLITDEKRFGGLTRTKPEHDNWTLKPYLGGLIKEFWNGDDWIESATEEEVIIFNNTLNKQKKKEANELLKETDWYVIRFQETGKPIPQEIIDLREQIRNNY